MPSRVLSLDISASCTGWAFTTAKGNIYSGCIKTTPKFSHSERLMKFKDELTSLIKKFKPTDAVMEDIFSGPNVKTLVFLAKFSGVAQETCRRLIGKDPYIIHTNTVKAFFKLKNKEEIFYMVVDIMDWDNDDWNFKKDNDITDALAQMFCYMDKILKTRNFRTEKPYGYLYGV